MRDSSDIFDTSISDNNLIINENYKKYEKYKLKYLKLLEIYGGGGSGKGSSGRGKGKGKGKGKSKNKKQKQKKSDGEGDDGGDDGGDDDYGGDDDDDEGEYVSALRQYDDYRNKYTEITPNDSSNKNNLLSKQEILILPGLVITSLCIISSIISNFR